MVSARVQASQQRRRSGAAGIHGDRRTKRQRTRQARQGAAIVEQTDR